jgi:hypothetical protein
VQLFQTISRKSLSIWLSLLCILSLWASFSLSASAEDDTIPSLIAWQQSEGSGAEEQRLAYLPEVDNWCDYPWNRGTETGNTVGQAGCSLLSIVNAVYYRTGSFLHPAKLAQFALDNGYRIPGVDGAAMGFFPAVAQAAEESHMTFAGWTTQAAAVLEHLRNGGTASANIAGHWIALVDYDVTTDQYLMLDSSQISSRAEHIAWTDRENGVAWLSEAVLLENGRNGYYGINNRYSALYTFDDPYTLGDVNQDGVVSVEDARLVLQYYASTAASLDFRLHPQIVTHNAGLSAADIDGDGLVTVQDATAILSYYAQQAAGAEPSWGQVLCG